MDLNSLFLFFFATCIRTCSFLTYSSVFNFVFWIFLLQISKTFQRPGFKYLLVEPHCCSCYSPLNFHTQSHLLGNNIFISSKWWKFLELPFFSKQPPTFLKIYLLQISQSTFLFTCKRFQNTIAALAFFYNDSSFAQRGFHFSLL